IPPSDEPTSPLFPLAGSNYWTGRGDRAPPDSCRPVAARSRAGGSRARPQRFCGPGLSRPYATVASLGDGIGLGGLRNAVPPARAILPFHAGDTYIFASRRRKARRLYFGPDRSPAARSVALG